MLRKIIAINRTYYVNWTAKDVCSLFEVKVVKASDLIQSNKLQTNKLIRELYLLACRASINSNNLNNKESLLLRSYANSIRQISDEYQNLFRRTEVKEMIAGSGQETDKTINSIDRLQARLFYLMTQYSLHPCTHLAGHIVKQLTCLCQHPNIELLPAQHYIYCQLINYWRSRLINKCIPANKQELH
jgi:hypothetical protein